MSKFTNAPRVDVVGMIEKRLGVTREEAERLAALKETREVSAFDFIKLNYLSVEGHDEERDRERAEDKYTAARSVLNERQSQAAKKPRPSRRHPRRAEVVEMARCYMARDAGMAVSDVAVLVACDMVGEDIPHHETIAKWIRQEIAQR